MFSTPAFAQDNDNDGVDNSCDLCPDSSSLDNRDFDLDSIGNVCDNCLLVSNTLQIDSDVDGFGDLCDNCPANPNPDQLDMDLDSIGNICDPDIDGDGLNNIVDCDQLDSLINYFTGDACDDGDQYTSGDVWTDCNTCEGVFIDADGDGITDALDNCPATANAGQADADSDGIGDVCDICFGNNGTGDTDGDGICDDEDNCDNTANPLQEDLDNDGIGDACDPDKDGDGFLAVNECDDLNASNTFAVGDSCDDGNAFTSPDTYNGSCNCYGPCGTFISITNYTTGSCNDVAFTSSYSDIIFVLSHSNSGTFNFRVKCSEANAEFQWDYSSNGSSYSWTGYTTYNGSNGANYWLNSGFIVPSGTTHIRLRTEGVSGGALTSIDCLNSSPCAG